jgi:hypothetical protein
VSVWGSGVFVTVGVRVIVGVEVIVEVEVTVGMMAATETEQPFAMVINTPKVEAVTLGGQAVLKLKRTLKVWVPDTVVALVPVQVVAELPRLL